MIVTQVGHSIQPFRCFGAFTATVTSGTSGLNIAARSAQFRPSECTNGSDDDAGDDSTRVGAVGFTAPSRRGRSSYLSLQAVLPAALLHGLFNFVVVLINSMTSDTSRVGHAFLRHGGCVLCSNRNRDCLTGVGVASLLSNFELLHMLTTAMCLLAVGMLCARRASLCFQECTPDTG